MKHLLLPFTFLLLFFFLIGNTTAQNFEWAKQLGGASSDAGRSIALDASGNVYIAGYFRDSADFDPSSSTFNLSSAGLEDIFISKLDASGNLLWAKRIGGTGSDMSFSMVVDATGNVYTTGRFYDTVDFDPGPSTFNLTSAGLEDIFISKLDASGNLLWAKRIGGINRETALSIAVDSTGNVYTTGYFKSTVDFNPGSGTFNLTSSGFNNDIFVNKLDSLGNFIWAKNMGGTGSASGWFITVDALGNVYTTGQFEGMVDFDPGSGVLNHTSSGSEDIFISKLNASGNFIWAKRMGGMIDDVGLSIAVDSTGNIYTTGYFRGTVDFDPSSGTLNLTSSGSRDIFVSKLDTSGNFLWAKKMGGTGSDYSWSIVLDSSNNIYTTGKFGDFGNTADFDPGPGTFNLTSASWNSDIFVSKLDSLGNFLWARKMGGTGSDKSFSIALDASENVYTTGQFLDTADFDPGLRTFNLTSVGNSDIFVHKMKCANSSTQNLTACDSYTWIDNVTYTSTTNTPTFTLTNSFGCDSVVTLNLTINSNDTTISVNNDTLIANQQGASYKWLNCDSSYSTINGATTQSFTPSQNGNYACEISLNGCVDTTACVQVIVTGIEKNALSEAYKIYPNPFTNQITIESVEVHSNTHLEVINIKGQVIYEGTTLLNGNTVLNTADWSKGIYFIRLTNEQGVGTFKLAHQ